MDEITQWAESAAQRQISMRWEEKPRRPQITLNTGSWRIPNSTWTVCDWMLRTRPVPEGRASARIGGRDIDDSPLFQRRQFQAPPATAAATECIQERGSGRGAPAGRRSCGRCRNGSLDPGRWLKTRTGKKSSPVINGDHDGDCSTTNRHVRKEPPNGDRGVAPFAAPSSASDEAIAAAYAIVEYLFLFIYFNAPPMTWMGPPPNSDLVSDLSLIGLSPLRELWPIVEPAIERIGPSPLLRHLPLDQASTPAQSGWLCCGAHNKAQ